MSITILHNGRKKKIAVEEEGATQLSVSN